jgi:hypothetical protein
VASISDVVRLAELICNTTFVPQGLRGSAPATAATILYGREIGIPPITALQTMHVINGRVGMAAELMRAQVLAAGHELEIVESTAALCRMRGRRRGSDTWTTVQWSKGDAQQAKLSGDGWTKYPRAMLLARCSAELCRAVFPDVTHGMAALEEMDAPSANGAAPEGTTPPRLVGRSKRAQATPQTPPQAEGDTASPPPPQPAVAPPPQPAQPPAPQPLLPDELTPEDDEKRPPPQVGTPAASVGVVHTDHSEADPHAQAKLTGDGPATAPQGRHIHLLLRKIGVGAERSERLAIAEAITQRRLESFSQLTVTDAGRLITTLLIAADSDSPRDYVRWLMDEGQRILAEREQADRDAMAQADTEGGVGDE